MAKKKLVFSWCFAPYINSTGLSLYKNLLHSKYNYDVVQMKDVVSDQRILDFDYEKRFRRFEVVENKEILTAEGMQSASKIAIVKNLIGFIFKGIKTFNSNKQEYDCVLSNSAEYISHIPAYWIKLRNRNQPWIAIFTDSLSGNPYFEYDSNYQSAIIKVYYKIFTFIEKQVFKKADKLIFLNQYQKEAAFKKYSPELIDTLTAKVEYVNNSYVDEMFNYADNLELQDNHNQTGSFVISHVGSIYGRRSLADVIAAVKYLFEQQQITEGDLVIQIVGKIKEQEQELITENIKCFFKFLAPVPYLESLKIMQKSDALLLIDGIFPETEHNIFMAGKLADYFGAQKPILAITMSQGITTDLINETGNYTYFGNDTEGLAKTIQALIAKQQTPNLQSYAHFDSKEAAKKIDGIIYNLINGCDKK